MLPLKEYERGFIVHSKHYLQGKAGEEPLSRAVYVPFYSNKVKGKQEKQVKYTYELIDAKIFMTVTKWNEEKVDIVRW